MSEEEIFNTFASCASHMAPIDIISSLRRVLDQEELNEVAEELAKHVPLSLAEVELINSAKELMDLVQAPRGYFFPAIVRVEAAIKLLSEAVGTK